jgi:hypothetical protein
MSTLTMATIELSDLTQGEVRNLAGHDRGLKAREFFHVNELDESDEVVDVRVPVDFRAVSPSFFQGMFADSVHHFGTADAFFAHYHFDAPIHIRSRLAEYAEQLAGR